MTERGEIRVRIPKGYTLYGYDVDKEGVTFQFDKDKRTLFGSKYKDVTVKIAKEKKAQLLRAMLNFKVRKRTEGGFIFLSYPSSKPKKKTTKKVAKRKK